MPGGFDEYPNLGFNDFPGSNVLKLAQTTTTIPSPVVHDELAVSTGVHTSTSIGATNFTFDKLGAEFDKYTATAFNDLPSGDTLKLQDSGGIFDLSGKYTIQYAFAAPVVVQVDADWAFIELPVGSSASLELRVSNDGSTWSAWEVFTSGVKAGKYFEFRLGLASTSIYASPEVTRLAITFSPYAGPATYFDSGYYVVQYDINQATTCDLAVDKFLFVLPPGVSATLDYRYSIDGVIWSPWQIFMPSKKTFRYLEFRMNLATTDNTLTPEVTRFSVAIDVPDIDQKGTSVVPLAGQTLAYPAPYNFTPALVVTAEGTDCRAEYSSATKNDFFVIVKKVSDGTALAGRTVNWITKGY